MEGLKVEEVPEGVVSRGFRCREGAGALGLSQGQFQFAVQTLDQSGRAAEREQVEPPPAARGFHNRGNDVMRSLTSR